MPAEFPKVRSKVEHKLNKFIDMYNFNFLWSNVWHLNYLFLDLESLMQTNWGDWSKFIVHCNSIIFWTEVGNIIFDHFKIVKKTSFFFKQEVSFFFFFWKWQHNEANWINISNGTCWKSRMSILYWKFCFLLLYSVLVNENLVWTCHI